MLIFLREENLVGGNTPLDAQVGVVPCYGTFAFGGIEIVALVLEDGFGTEDGETVSKPLTDEELAMVIASEFYSNMLSISWGTLANVYCHIKNPPFHNAHEFALGKGRTLEMETTQHAIVRQGFVILNKVDVHPRLLGKFACIKTLEKIAAGIAKHTRLDDINTFKFGLNDFHVSS